MRKTRDIDVSSLLGFEHVSRQRDLGLLDDVGHIANKVSEVPTNPQRTDANLLSTVAHTANKVGTEQIFG